ncbi:MAG: hypothetical protein ACLR02_09490 [Clostridium sp.]|nr:hypothetical protein [Clostridium sp.]
MDKELIKAIDVAKELGLYLKMVVSTKEYNNYNSFYNIYGEHEEPCRRILVLTSYEELEEVNEIEGKDEFEKYNIVDGNMWLEEYPLTFNPNKVDFEKVYITKEAYNKLKEKLKK